MCNNYQYNALYHGALTLLYYAKSRVHLMYSWLSGCPHHQQYPMTDMHNIMLSTYYLSQAQLIYLESVVTNKQYHGLSPI